MNLRRWFEKTLVSDEGEPFCDPLKVEECYLADIAELNRTNYKYPGKAILPNRSSEARRSYKRFSENYTMGETNWYKYLYYLCHLDGDKDGILTVDCEQVLLVGTDGNALTGQADLVGLRMNGGLVVFECKVAKLQQPLSSMLQALTYLASFMAKENYAKISREIESMMARLRKEGNLPASYEGVAPSASSKAMVIVLAPLAYYERVVS